MLGLGRLAVALGVVAAATAGAAGCVRIDGGAVEVPWTLFAPDGRAINDCSCTAPALAEIEVVVVPAAGGADVCAGQSSCRFACSRKIEATPFFIPAGDYNISLQALGADGAALPFTTPAPVRRPVVKGQLSEIDAIEIVAPCAAVCHGGEDGGVNTQPCGR